MNRKSLLSLVVIMALTVALLSAAGSVLFIPDDRVKHASVDNVIHASNSVPAPESDGKRKVDLRADDAYYISKGDSTIFILVGNFAAHHNGAVIMADSAVRYSNQSFECFGNVLINQNDTYVYGERAEYNNQTAEATVYSDIVKIIDGEAVMYTYHCKYNTSKEVGEFSGGCYVEKGANLMESQRGIYNTKTHDLTAIERVEMRDDVYQMRGDSVIFNTQTENAQYFTRSNIWNDKDEYLYADAGTYTKELDLHHLTRNAYILSPEREIWSDSIEYYRTDGHIIGRRNIQLHDIEQNVKSFADYGEWWDEPGNAFFTGRPSMINYDADTQDSVYISADTLWLYTIAVEPPITELKDSTALSDDATMEDAATANISGETMATEVLDDEKTNSREERQERREQRREERQEKREERRRERDGIASDMAEVANSEMGKTQMKLDEPAAEDVEEMEEAVEAEKISPNSEMSADEPLEINDEQNGAEEPLEEPVVKDTEVDKPMEVVEREVVVEDVEDEVIVDDVEDEVIVEEKHSEAELPAVVEEQTQSVDNTATNIEVEAPKAEIMEEPAAQEVSKMNESSAAPKSADAPKVEERQDVKVSATPEIRSEASRDTVAVDPSAYSNQPLRTMTLAELAKRQSYLPVDEYFAEHDVDSIDKSDSDALVEESKPLSPKELRRKAKSDAKSYRDSIKERKRFVKDSIEGFKRAERDSLARLERIERDSLKAIEQQIKDSLYKLKYGERDSLRLVERAERDSLRRIETDSLIAKRQERSARIADEQKAYMERIAKKVQDYQRKKIERAKARAARRGKEYKGPEFEDLFPDAAAADSLAAGGDGHDHDHDHDHGHHHDHGDMPHDGADTLAMGADSMNMDTDSLVDVQKPFPADSSYKMVKAYRNVKLYRSDSQMVCDSLVTLNTDSIVHLYKNPILWNESNQIISDSMAIYTRRQKMEKAHFMGNPLMISEIDTMYYNQVKGKDMTSYFADGKVTRNDVDGNAQTIYFMQEEDAPDVTGLMYIESAGISFYFEEGEIIQIVYKQNPEYVLYPMDMIPESQTRRLPDFAWHINMRPTRDSVLTRVIRPSQRENEASRTKPTFRITERINNDRNRLIESNRWLDRIDVLPPEVVEWRNSRPSYNQHKK